MTVTQTDVDRVLARFEESRLMGEPVTTALVVAGGIAAKTYLAWRRA